MERLEELAVAPLSLVDRFQQEVPRILEDQSIPATAMNGCISRFREEIYLQCKTKIDEFAKEAESAEQGSLKRAHQVREIRKRAQLIHDLVESLLHPITLPDG
jgi:hypothetical protein